jgi:hypothetical protein
MARYPRINMKIIFQEDDGTIIREEIISEEESTAMLTDMVDITEWVTNAVREKGRRRIDDIVAKSGLGSKHTDQAAKISIIAALKASKHPLLKTGKEKNAEAEAQRKGEIECQIQK